MSPPIHRLSRCNSRDYRDGPVYLWCSVVGHASGKQIGLTFDWLSSKQEAIDWEKTNWYVTPTASYADYTALATLPKVKLTQ